VAAARDRNRQVLVDDVRGRGLEIIELRVQTVERGGDSREWRSEGTQILAPRMERSCGSGLPETFEFVKNAAGELWALQAWPAAKTRRNIAVCACASQQSFRGCGAAPEPVQVVFELPAGMTFRGALDVPYQVEEVSISYADHRKGSGCPPMPEPPP